MFAKALFDREIHYNMSESFSGKPVFDLESQAGKPIFTSEM
jgi:hypothetical protein